ncbi:MAG: hypothetical protein ABSE56_12265 [Bryobacteraceae bacterium]
MEAHDRVEILKALERGREAGILAWSVDRRFVESCRGDLRFRLATHPLLGPVNCHEALLLMAVHPHRHPRRIQEIKAALG